MDNEPTVIGTKGLIGPTNLPKKTPGIPYLLENLRPCSSQEGLLLNGQILSILLLKYFPIRKLKISAKQLDRYTRNTT